MISTVILNGFIFRPEMDTHGQSDGCDHTEVSLTPMFTHLRPFAYMIGVIIVAVGNTAIESSLERHLASLEVSPTTTSYIYTIWLASYFFTAPLPGSSIWSIF